MNNFFNSCIPFGMCLWVENRMFSTSCIPLGMHPDRMQKGYIVTLATGSCILTGCESRYRLYVAQALYVKCGIVACRLTYAISHTMKQEGISHSWKRIRDIMSSQTMVTARMKLEHKDSLILRSATRPNQEQAKLYSVLKLKQTNPNMRKKQ